METLIVIDTDIFIDHFRGIQEATNYLRDIPAFQRATTDVNVMELFKGASNLHELMIIEQFLTRNNFTLLSINVTASSMAVELLRQHSLSQGLSISDALIAGIVLEYNYLLVTRNLRHFRFIPKLKIIAPSYYS